MGLDPDKLDRWITGNYGEDQYMGGEDWEEDYDLCSDCGKPVVWDEDKKWWVHETSNPSCFLNGQP